MGIKGLMPLLDSEAKGCCKETEKGNYMGRKIAIDASMQLYNFMVMVTTSQNGGPAQHLTNEAGEVTSHIQGFFHRTINLLNKGLKPIFVFDGKPPDFKDGELEKRKAAKEKAREEKKAAEEKLKEATGEALQSAIEDINKLSKRNASVTPQHNEDVQKLLRLMGLPVVIAPCEAEAQCAELCRKGVVYATATEDMDALTFSTPILLRKLTVPEKQKVKVVEIHLEKVLALLKLTMDEFIDLCILCGCDYCPSIRSIGPKTALKLIREHGTIEKIVKNLDAKKYTVPEKMMARLDKIRELFKTPDVTEGSEVDLTFSPPKTEELIEYLVKEKGFDESRVKSALKKLRESKSQTSQKRLDSFFKPKPSTGPVTGFKRTGKDKKKGGPAKRGRGRGRGRR